MLPPDIHEHVLDLCAELVNASIAGDVAGQWRIYNELAAYGDAVAAQGRDHAFLWETLGDFTADHRAALQHYSRALELAERHAATEYEASVCLAMARRHADLDERGEASAYAWRAHDVARNLDDLDLRREVSQLLVDLQTS